MDSFNFLLIIFEDAKTDLYFRLDRLFIQHAKYDNLLKKSVYSPGINKPI
jgi:hypothetical protein